jgi:hypothetical protein
MLGEPMPMSSRGIMDCGGKRSATPLWLQANAGRCGSAEYCQGKRRRASLAAAVHISAVSLLSQLSQLDNESPL